MSKPSDKSIERTLALMHKRGPDNCAFKSSYNGRYFTTLLHSRLSIIDLDTRANQPFSIDEVTLVFNGEIYNYIELGEKLAHQGIQLRTLSDTEVLLHYYLLYGESCVEHFEGMWAFAIWDKPQGKLFLSRDRFGEKPLFVHHHGNGFFFASEIKFISSLAEKKFHPNEELLRKNLVFGYRARHESNETFFKEVFAFPAGHNMSISKEKSSDPTPYWHWKEVKEEPEMTKEMAVIGIRERLMKAVQIRLRADVPMAFCMSGGVDSNGIISIARKQFEHEVHGFTIANEDKRYDERSIVESAVKQLGIRHTWVSYQKENFLEHLKAIIAQHDSPLPTISYYVHWLLARTIAEKGYRVSFSGIGGDELFSGYFDHYLADLADARIRNASEYDRKLKDWQTNGHPIILNPLLRDPEAVIKNPNYSDHLYDHWKELGKYTSMSDDLDVPKQRIYCKKNVLRNRMLNETFRECIPIYLQADDANSMFFSVENRTPLLDSELFSFSLRIPSKLFVRDGYTKDLLRQATAQWSPGEVVSNRRKTGFNAPLEDAIDLQDTGFQKWLWAENILGEYVEPNSVSQLLQKQNLDNHESKFLFNLISTRIFLEEFGSQ